MVTRYLTYACKPCVSKFKFVCQRNVLKLVCLSVPPVSGTNDIDFLPFSLHFLIFTPTKMGVLGFFYRAYSSVSEVRYLFEL